ncbi:DUF1223 domain-containing protein [Falsihalocynthiibacter arcticus]|uniref:DUF1223 domain-containing protein n=1 Tax=Falsihalocynthiibacter arcticus TaxID=1579316 RepID=UPI0009ED9EE8|nr:DUF1223 domain-containing protein [Falsihalocynthiibacter arcticus]
MTAIWTRAARALALSLGFSAICGAANAQSGPVVVELYTSQGCSSCPPADALLDQLAQRRDIIALGLHVDYWDYIGWKDVFGDPAFTERQRNYSRAAGTTVVYTPQMVIGGVEHVVGNKPADVERAIKKAMGVVSPVTLSVVKNGPLFVIEAQSKQRADMVVQLVRFVPNQSVKIRGGENNGREVSYSNIVTDWRVLKKWNGATPFSAKVDPKGAHHVIIIQRAGHGPILAAARLD